MEPVVSLNPDTTLGAYQIGVLISYVLFGVTTAQMYIYYTRFPEDSIQLKILVAFVWGCELAHTLCIGYGLYVWTISEYGHPELIFGHSNTSLAIAVVFSGLIGASVQGFFSFRIYSLSRKVYIPLFIWIISFWRLLSSILVLTGTLQSSTVEGAEGQWGWALLASWSVSAANDLVITVALVTILIRQRTYAQKRTVVLVDKLIAWTIETGMLTSACGILMLICFVTMRNNYIFLAFFAVEARMFSNSLLASLNSREMLRAMNEVSAPISLPPLPTFEFSSNIASPTKPALTISNAGQRDEVVYEDV
ncbi:hypothetical protein B0H17DRAFT_1107338 [Mycena rosella]|uniref:DUF6534 domain-containing protein n=1 Tax=Mycena rosella TaxID=1033263 RepID=A0AAD7C0K1_MYCRO|nr:hypothetical protein B0H17DRAFT_1107338 [Mycena rosella]